MADQASSLTIVSVLLCLVALGWCIVLVRRVRMGPARYLVGVTGLLSAYHGSKVLAMTGMVDPLPLAGLDKATELAMTAMFLVSVAMLQYYIVEFKRLQYKFRLVEAAEQPPPQKFTVSNRHNAQVLYQAMSDSCPLPVVAVDPAGAICYWNVAAERKLGWLRDEVLGKHPPFKLLKAADSAPEAYVTRKDGKQLPCTVWTAPFQTSGGEIYGTLTILGCRVSGDTGARPALPPPGATASCLADAECPA